MTYASRSLQITNEPALGGFRISKTTVNHRRWSVVMKSRKETKEEVEKRREERGRRRKVGKGEGEKARKKIAYLSEQVCRSGRRVSCCPADGSLANEQPVKSLHVRGTGTQSFRRF